MEPILQAWEDFARTIEPPALTMTDNDLRDHARQMLLVFADDLETEQSDVESAAKSIGHGKRGKGDTAAEVHAEARLLSGYTVVQLVSEYRALRASVLALWAARVGDCSGTVMVDMMRFNEAVDQTLAESVARYQSLVKQSQNMFLAILGHDLRNPLGTLVSGSSIIMQGADVPPKYVLVAKRMFDGARRMSRLINDLIDFTRTHLGPGIPIRAGESDLTALCTQVTNELRTAHPQRHIDLRAPHRLEAVFDEGRVAQMLSNLIGNALQYGSKDAPVAIGVTDTDREISIVINNRGPAIPPDKIASIFDPMVRIAASACDEDEDTERTSLGIGLFISREIALAHGGQVGVVSNAADGTTFTVTMPRWPGGARPAGMIVGNS
ncbi:sensor histidine kinase [Pseudoduganella lutea]|nr:sensor histidine kinase [Pseudoduganella lutea]